MRFNLTRFLFSLSTALDYVEMDVLKRSTNHGKRVGVIASKMGRTLGLTEEEVFDLSAYAIMHDSGLAGYANDAKIWMYEALKEHCTLGESFVSKFPFLTHQKNILLYHHENYNGTGYFGISKNDIPLFSQIICLADYADILIGVNRDKKRVLDAMKAMKGSNFSAELVDAYEQTQLPASFSLDLDNMFLHQVIDEKIPNYYMSMGYEDLIGISQVFSKIIDAKSKFTARHSSGIAEKIARMADFYGYDAERKAKIIIAANLHDVGKLAVPNRILDKPGKLGKDEFEIIKKHTYFTRMILKQIEGFEEITEWASNHHEKLNGSGYPMGFDADRLDFGSRLMACIDIYQALTEERPYRKGMAHDDAIRILRQNAEAGAIDIEIVTDIDNEFREDTNDFIYDELSRECL